MFLKASTQSLSKQSKMNKVNTLNLLGLAQRAGKVVSGETFVLEKIKSKEAKLVFVASDASLNTSGRIKDKAWFYEIEVIDIFTSEELSNSIGKTSRKTIAVLDKGFAEKMKT